jgi:bifunctional non-homologous end joining protein LigD
VQALHWRNNKPAASLGALPDDIPRFNTALIRPFPDPFDNPDWLFELKYDGFRALAYGRSSGVELVSRTGHVYSEFAPLCAGIAAELAGVEVVLDGEIACLDEHGRTQFDALMSRRGQPCFVAFDVLWHGATDLRAVPLWKRKEILRRLVPKRSSAMLYAECVVRCGTALYRIAYEKDLEGIVAKWRHGAYSPDPPASWLKIKNPDYSQAVGRHARFARKQTG